MGQNFTVSECKTAEQQEAVYILLEKHYTYLTPELIRSYGATMLDEDWHMLGVFDQGRCVATLMYRIGTRFFAGKHVVHEALYIDEAYRMNGLANLLFDWLEQHAQKQGCGLSLLYSYADNLPAHRFFYKRGFGIRGFVFFKEISPEAIGKPLKSGTMRLKKKG